MASELIVQNLKGPSSGSNANKIIVPSGHTLSAAGHIIQTVIGPKFHTEASSTSSSFSVVSSSLAASITPKFATSKIFVTCNIANLMFWNGSADARNQLGISSDSGSTFVREFNSRIYDYGGSGIQSHYVACLQCVDEPNSTNQQTYNLYWKIQAGNARINDDQGTEGVSGTAGACFTQFIIQEIAQ